MEYGLIFHGTRTVKYYCKNMKYRIIYIYRAVDHREWLASLTDNKDMVQFCPGPASRGEGCSEAWTSSPEGDGPSALY